MQEVWKVSTTAGSKRVKKGSSTHEASTSSSHTMKENEVPSKSSVSAPSTGQPCLADSSQVSYISLLGFFLLLCFLPFFLMLLSRNVEDFFSWICSILSYFNKCFQVFFL